VIEHPDFTVEPWCLRATDLDLDVLAQTESVFVLSNGHIGWRANLDEGEPHGLPGCYLNGVFEERPLPYAEAGYGFPESGQTVINVTNGKLIRLFVDDEAFDIRYGELREHERLLDFREGVLHRHATWTSPAGQGVRVSTQRMVSFTQRSVAAIHYQVQALHGPVRVVVQSELVTNEQLPAAEGDPRMATVLEAPLRSEAYASHGTWVELVHCTAHSRLRVAAAMDHIVEEPSEVQTLTEAYPDLGRVTFTANLKPGQSLRLVKFVAYGWSGVRSLSGVRDQVGAALVAARQTGWAGLVAEQRAYLDEFWAQADVELDGDPELQQAVRFALFHILQASARAEGRAIPAKGLTGPGYDGHAFWDTETFVLPVLSYTLPEAAADALRWRHSTLPLALDRARQLGLAGAVFPWRSIRGEECSSYWPAGTAAFHVGADVADAVLRYIRVTGDTDFERAVGVELLVQTARLWQSLGHHDATGRFRLDGVTGPDEYSAVADNNVYTNLMAQQNLQAAADVVERHPNRADELGVQVNESAAWRAAAEAIFIPYDEVLGVHPQSEGFTAHQVWNFAETPAEDYPLLLHAPYFELYRKQVVKQADLVLAMHMRGDAFTKAEKARNFAYYEALTVRDSSLSACTQAVIAAEVGHLDLAYDYLGEATLMDLDDLEHDTRDGLHIASLAGAWTALVFGFGGMRDADGTLDFTPRLPSDISRLAFTIRLQQRCLRVEVSHATVSYTLIHGEALDISHQGEVFTVRSGAGVVHSLAPARTTLEPPSQPAGREPVRRRGRTAGIEPTGERLRRALD
jgi:alpha,alpha-trehalose phosphorylase